MARKPDSQFEYQIRSASRACLGEVWVCDPQKLDQICDLLERREAGVMASEETILETTRSAEQASFRQSILNQRGEEDEGQPVIVDHVQVTQLYGTLAPRMNLMQRFSGGTSLQKFASEVLEAADNEDVRRLLIEADTPGGTFTSTPEAGMALQAFRRAGKEIRIAGRGMVCSAGYWIAVNGTWFSAEPSTDIGSIGVYAIYREFSKAAEKEGVKFHVFRAGQLKASDNPYEPLTPERKKSLQERVDAPYRMFLQMVATGRGVDVETVARNYGQGSTFLAEEALDRGMIDDVLTIEEAFADERRRAMGSQSVRVAGVPLAKENGNEDHHTPARAGSFSTKGNDMNKRLKALMFGMGLIAEDASDEVCNATLAGWFGARGMQRPDDDEKTIKALVAAQNGTTSPAFAQGGGDTGTGGGGNDGGIPANVRAARDRELAEAREEAARAAVARADAIRAGAQRLQDTGLSITDEQISAAIADRNLQTAEQAIGSLVSGASSGSGGSGGRGSQHADERGVGRIVGGQAEQDRFYAAAIAGLSLRCGAEPNTPAAELPTGAIELSRESMNDIVRRDLSYRGIECRGMDREAAASVWLQQGGAMFFSGDRFAAESSISSAGDFPNVLSGWSRRMLDRALQLANTTYQRWCAQHPSVNDLHPHLIVGTGPMGLLEDIADDEKAPQDQINEEALAWFKAQRKSKKVPLTAVMVAHDDLGAFTQQLQALRTAQELTLEDMAVRLLVANGNMLTGNALFSAAHANIVAAAAGGAPSDPQAALMRLLLQRQTMIGGRHVANLTPDLVLVPPALEDDAKRTYLPLVQFAEQKSPITDATLSVARGSIRDVVTIPLLETIGGATGLQMWYVFANPAIAPVVKYVYMRGYENGRTDTWFDPDRQTRYFRIETRAAVFANHYRGGARNAGV